VIVLNYRYFCKYNTSAIKKSEEKEMKTRKFGKYRMTVEQA